MQGVILGCLLGGLLGPGFDITFSDQGLKLRGPLTPVIVQSEAPCTRNIIKYRGLPSAFLLAGRARGLKISRDLRGLSSPGWAGTL